MQFLLRSTLPALPLLLAACATTPTAAPVPPPPVQPGLELLMGQPVETALQLLGQPRLDKREGEARQLQFAGPCILDIWYYPGADARLRATHADARQKDGRDMPPGACLRLRQLQQARTAQTTR